ncbi:MAG: hypothetical protein AB8G99_25335 [Planctomycetaceae bacterium]
MSDSTFLTQWLEPATSDLLVAGLLHFLWQATLIGVVAALANRILRNRSSAVRYWVQFVCLIIMAAALPLNVAMLSRTEKVSPAETVRLGTSSETGVVEAMNASPAATPSVGGGEAQVPESASKVAVPVVSGNAPAATSIPSVVSAPASVGGLPTSDIVLAWLIGTLVMALRW